MKHRHSIRILYALLFAWNLNGFSRIVEASNLVFRVQVNELDVLAHPDPFAMVITNVPYKTEISVLESQSQGAWVRIEDGGWVHRSGITHRSLENTNLTSEAFSNLVNEVVQFLTVGVDNGWTNRQVLIQK